MTVDAEEAQGVKLVAVSVEYEGYAIVEVMGEVVQRVNQSRCFALRIGRAFSGLAAP